MLFFTSIDVDYHICKLVRKIPVGRLKHVYRIIVMRRVHSLFFLTFNSSAGSCGLVRIHIAK